MLSTINKNKDEFIFEKYFSKLFYLIIFFLSFSNEITVQDTNSYINNI